MRHLRILLTALILACALAPVTAPPEAAAQSLTLDEAKAQGLVGEQRDGYLGVVRDGPGVRALVDEINLKRRQHYREIARQNNTSLEAVAKITAKKVIERAPSGTIVEGPDGGWVRKP